MVLTQFMGEFGGPTPAFQDWICFPLYNMVQQLDQVLEPQQLPALKPGHFGVYDPTQDRSRISKKEQDQEDLIIVMEILPDFTKLSRGRLHLPGEDELTAAMHPMMEANSADALPTHAVFALQIFLDIHHVLREDITRPFDQMQTIGKRTIETLDDYFRFSRGRTIDLWPAQNDAAFRQVRDFARDCTQADTVCKAFSSVYRKLGVTPKPFFFLKSHPVLCGLLTYRLTTLMQECGITLCNAWGSIIFPAHLYNATRQSASLEAHWKHMEYVVSLHSAQRIFVGAPPTEPTEYLKRFVLALGGSASNFARNRRRGGPSLIVESKKGPRGLKTTTPVKDIFHLRYVAGDTAKLTTPNIVAMLSVASKAERTSPAPDDLQMFTRQMLTQRQFTPLQLLRIVREGVAAEELHLLFDYISLHQRSLKLLRTLQTHLHADLVKYFSEQYIEEESQLLYIIGYLFEVVCGSARIAEHLRVEGGSRMLHTTAEVMERYLQDGQNSSKSLDVAKALSAAGVSAGG